VNARDFAEFIDHATPRTEGYEGRCPAHEDNKPSLTWKDGDKALVVKCHRGCTVDQICAALRLELTDLFPESPNGHHGSSGSAGRRIVATYQYRDLEGHLLYEVLRYEPKDFRQRRWGPGGPIWNVQDTPRVLYRLPEIQGATEVVVVEGEKDADRLARLGFAATTSVMGAGKWQEIYAEQLKAAGATRIFIIPDNDTAGQSHALDVARSCCRLELDARMVRLSDLRPTQARHGEDVSDWLDNGHSHETLSALLSQAEPFQESAPDPSDPGPATKMLRGAEIFAVTVQEPDWLVERIFSRSHQHMILGASQGAKTWAAFDLGVSIAHPGITHFLGQEIRAHGRVVIESWEQGQAEDVRRIQKLVRGHQLSIASEDLILLSDPPAALSDDAYFDLRYRQLREWAARLYIVDSLSESAGIELNDNTAYTGWWRSRIKPLLDLGLTVVITHLKGHPKAGVEQNRDSASRGATQIRALSTGVLDLRQLTDTLFHLRHNKHRNGTALPFGTIELEGQLEEDFVRLILKADATMGAGKELLAEQLLTRLAIAAAADRRPFRRTDIEAALNQRGKPADERVSKKIYEPVLTRMVAEKRLEQSKAGNADVWSWIGPEEDAE
jgi:hypothetical protein